MYPEITPRDPLVVQVLRNAKAALAAYEDHAMYTMATAWIRMEQALEAEMSSLASEIAVLQKAGRVADAAMIRQHERTTRLVYQAHAEMMRYITYASGEISGLQEQFAERGLLHAADAIRAAYTEAGVIGEAFDILPVGAINAMIGLAGDGSPLEQYLRTIYDTATGGMLDALVDGVAKGLNPIEIAREMRDGFGIGLQHAINTARTESLRAYRFASQEQYRASGVVLGWKRLAAHDERTCAGCLFTEGEFYPNEQAFQEHNQGRCTLVPVVMGTEEPNWMNGQAWFLMQPEDVQMSILGQGRFEAWKNGVNLDAMVTRRNDPVWGESFVPTPVEQLTIPD